MHNRPRFTPLLLALATLVACDEGPVQWQDTHALASGGSASARLALLETGGAGLARYAPPPSPAPEDACPGSVAYAQLAGNEWHRAWWRATERGTHLVTSKSRDAGRTWSVPIVVDTSDRARSGCSRLPPAIAADSITRYIHLVYYMRPPNGAGIWYAHSMDGGATWHSQYGLIYGDDPARASVAADGPTVAIAYELPNAAERKVGLSLSRDGGHSFLRPVLLSPGGGSRVVPVAAAKGDRVGIAWQGPGGTLVARVGRLRTE